MEQLITKDGSTTYFNEEYQEQYHSLSGAVEEAIKKYTEPCKIKQIAKQKNEIQILDICFGLGYNTAAALDAISKTNPNCKIKIVALEKDLLTLDSIKNLNPPFKNYNIIKKLAKNKTFQENNISIQLILGEATQTINAINQNFDAVFLDPFSPSKNPELWTTDFFKQIKQLMKEGAILSTYSCAKKVRNNFKEAGFTVEDGPCIGRKSPSTIAYF